MEELQNRQQEINQKLAEAIRNMEEMRCTGNNVNVELKRQDETLEKIDQTLDAIDQENKSSKKMLSSIGSFWGFIKNRITGWKYKPAELPKQSPTTTEQSNPARHQPHSNALLKSQDSAENEMLDQLLRQTHEVRSIVTTTNVTLTRQGDKINKISGKVDTNLNNIGVLNRQCRRLLD